MPGGGNWVGPVSSGIPFGFGMVDIYFSANAYIIDAFPGYVASALAAKTVVRSGSGAAMPLFITAMYHNLGNGWAASVWAFISLGMVSTSRFLMLPSEKTLTVFTRSPFLSSSTVTVEPSVLAQNVPLFDPSFTASCLLCSIAFPYSITHNLSVYGSTK